MSDLPDSLRKPWMPPGGTCAKSPGGVSVQPVPSWIRTVPDRMKKDSEMVRWKCGSGPLGPGPKSQR